MKGKRYAAGERGGKRVFSGGLLDFATSEPDPGGERACLFAGLSLERGEGGTKSSSASEEDIVLLAG